MRIDEAPTASTATNSLLLLFSTALLLASILFSGWTEAPSVFVLSSSSSAASKLALILFLRLLMLLEGLEEVVSTALGGSLDLAEIGVVVVSALGWPPRRPPYLSATSGDAGVCCSSASKGSTLLPWLLLVAPMLIRIISTPVCFFSSSGCCY